MGSALKFNQSKIAQQPGEVARLRVVQGPDSGCVFVMKSARATMGRGDENDIVLSDLKTSRRHAEIAADAQGGWHLRDLGSSNGILRDGKVIRDGTVKKGDRFTVGETQLEFLPAGALVAHATAPVPQVFVPQSLAMPQITGIGPSSGPGAQLNPRKLVIYAVSLVGIYLLLFVDAETPTAPKKVGKKREAERGLASYLPEYESSKLGPAEAFFREGFREYRERNYLRAKIQFETVLQISPSHYLAQIYLRKCEEDISREVEDHLTQGKRNSEAGRLKAARAHYESVLRLMHRDRTHASFVEAKEALSAVEKAMKGEATL